MYQNGCFQLNLVTWFLDNGFCMVLNAVCIETAVSSWSKLNVIADRMYAFKQAGKSVLIKIKFTSNTWTIIIIYLLLLLFSANLSSNRNPSSSYCWWGMRPNWLLPNHTHPLAYKDPGLSGPAGRADKDHRAGRYGPPILDKNCRSYTSYISDVLNQERRCY